MSTADYKSIYATPLTKISELPTSALLIFMQSLATRTQVRLLKKLITLKE